LYPSTFCHFSFVCHFFCHFSFGMW
jgi:hypothetical protein